MHTHHSGQLATIVSSFFRTPSRRDYGDVLLIGPLLRPEVRAARPSRGDFLVSNLPPHTPRRVIDVICNAPLPVKVYGLGARPNCGNGRFCEFSEQGFVRDLARCAALVGAAGDQTIGEALYLGKPVLALPEDRHHEQRINAYFLQQMGAGHMAALESFDSHHLLGFLNRLDELRESLANSDWQFDGNSMAVAAIERFLPCPAPMQPVSFRTQACDNHLSLAR